MIEATAKPQSSAASELSDDLKAKVKTFADRVQKAVGSVVVGAEAAVNQFLIALVARGHVLLEGVPGTAKTTLAKAFAHVLGIQYHRVQFTPDLLPADITGTYVFDRGQNSFVLRKGPLFCQLLLADEVNRAPAKTQAALLEAMQEHQVTIEGDTLKLPEPFLVMATQNPVEQEGVYRLPEAQLDRFLLRVEMGYPDRETEIDILKLFGGSKDQATARLGDNGQLQMPKAEFSTLDLLEMQQALSRVYAEPSIMQYIVDVARASRVHPDVALGASPRAALYLYLCARARALLSGRHYATHEDVHAIALPVLGHRLILKPESELDGRLVSDVVADVLKKVPVLLQPTATRG